MKVRTISNLEFMQVVQIQNTMNTDDSILWIEKASPPLPPFENCVGGVRNSCEEDSMFCVGLK